MATAKVQKQQMLIAKPSGPAIAAMMAGMLGLLAMALVNMGTEMSKPFSVLIHDLGKLWIPGAQGIGPYSGKETVALAIWLVGWVVLHLALRKRQLDERVWGALFLIGIGIATTIFWPPMLELIVG